MFDLRKYLTENKLTSYSRLKESSTNAYKEAISILKNHNLITVDLSTAENRQDFSSRVQAKLDTLENPPKKQECHYVYFVIIDEYPILAGEGNFNRAQVAAPSVNSSGKGLKSSHEKSAYYALWAAHIEYQSQKGNSEVVTRQAGLGIITPSLASSLKKSPKQVGKLVEDDLHRHFKVGKSGGAGSTAKPIGTALATRIKDYVEEFGKAKALKFFIENNYFRNALKYLSRTDSPNDRYTALELLKAGEDQYPGIVDAVRWLYGSDKFLDMTPPPDFTPDDRFLESKK